MSERRFTSVVKDRIVKPTLETLRYGLVVGTSVAGLVAMDARAEGPKEDDHDVSAARFVMTPPGAHKWQESNAYEEAISQEIQKNLFKIGEEYKIEWYEKEVPVAVLIPSLGIQSLLIPTGRIPDPNDPGSETYATPDFGIAVPKVPIKEGRHVNLLVYGHSRMYGVPQPFRSIAELNIGDTATIVSTNGENTQFEVVGFKLIDYEEDNTVKVERDRSIATFQTTAMEGDAWLVEEGELVGKVDMPTETSGHMALQVILEPVE